MHGSHGVHGILADRDAGVLLVLGHLLLALIDIAAGIVALVWPGPAALVLVIVVAVWALISGFLELAAMLDTRRLARRRQSHLPKLSDSPLR
jgi:uncharacterized membrane protein HdeD (DUF308 family)